MAATMVATMVALMVEQMVQMKAANWVSMTVETRVVQRDKK